jgi:protein TonB
MARAGTARNHDRLIAATATGALQAGLLYALITGLNIDIAAIPAEVLKVYDITQDPPPPPVEAVEQARTEEEEGAAAPPNLRAKPTPVVAPPPRVQLPVPPKIVASPVPSPIDGPDPSAGASDRAGPGTGAGGVGTGTGSGGAGTGGGSGGSGARRVRGSLSFERDYPRAARAIRAEGTVYVRISIAADGRVSACALRGPAAMATSIAPPAA